jgi:hypothetical protein
MPNNPFDRTIINPREKPLSEDVNIYLSQLDRALRFFAKALFSTTTGSPVSGFSQGSFRSVESSPQAMSIALKAGLGFQDLPGDVPVDVGGVLGVNDLESYKPLVLTADLTIPIPTAPAAPNSRIDIIEVRADRFKTDNQSRQVFDNATNSFSPTSVDKTLEFLLDGTKLGAVVSPDPSVAAVSLKQGIAGAPGVAPATTAGYIKIAEVFVDGDVVLIEQADITDFRPQLIDGLQIDPSVKTILVPAIAGQASADIGTGALSMVYGSNAWNSRSAVPMDCDIPIDGWMIKAGDRIIAIDVLCHDAAGAVMRFDLFESGVLPSIAAGLVADTVFSGGAAAEETVPITNISFNGGLNILEAGKTYRVRCRENTVIRPLTLRVYGLLVTYDTPI